MTGLAQGGYIPGTPVPVWIHPDKCLISAQPGRVFCVRPGHPTAKSECCDRRDPR